MITGGGRVFLRRGVRPAGKSARAERQHFSRSRDGPVHATAALQPVRLTFLVSRSILTGPIQAALGNCAPRSEL